MLYTLKDLGWSPFFARQTGATPDGNPYRITAVHRDRLTALGQSGETTLTTDGQRSTGEFAVGDWVLADDTDCIVHLLERQTLIQRRAAGTDARIQLVAANVDVLFIVSSCNDDFNIPRLERYLTLAYEAGCFPVIVLTKADLSDDARDLARQAERLDPAVPVLCVDALNSDDLSPVASWCPSGQTAAFVGSSGVGKTTLANGLTGQHAATGAIREDDAKGRHVTTSRTLIGMQNGGWIIDTPGMRALRLLEAQDGIERLFDDITQLTETCRFSDCQHDTEPGCAVTGAIADGTLDPARLARWDKLRREDRRNSETVAQSHTRDRAFGKMVRKAVKDKKARKKR